MSRLIPILAALMLAGVATPALAVPDCEDHSPGLHITFSVGVGGRYTDEEQEIFDKMHLRQNGIVAREVDRTDEECLKVFRKDEAGNFVEEYYDPKSFQLVLE